MISSCRGVFVLADERLERSLWCHLFDGNGSSAADVIPFAIQTSLFRVAASSVLDTENTRI